MQAVMGVSEDAEGALLHPAEPTGAAPALAVLRVRLGRAQGSLETSPVLKVPTRQILRV